MKKNNKILFKQQLHYQHIDIKFISIQIFYTRIIEKLI